MQDLDWLLLCYLHFLLTARAKASFITSRLQCLKFSLYEVLAAVNLSLAHTTSVLTTSKVYGYTTKRSTFRYVQTRRAAMNFHETESQGNKNICSKPWSKDKEITWKHLKLNYSALKVVKEELCWIFRHNKQFVTNSWLKVLISWIAQPTNNVNNFKHICREADEKEAVPSCFIGFIHVIRLKGTRNVTGC
jgi:hypothetical protein